MKPSFSRGKKAAALVTALLFSLILPATSAYNTNIKLTKQAQAAAAFSSQRSVDIMKYTKDVLVNQPSDAAIANLVSTVASMPTDYIAISIPMDPSSDYPFPSKPSPSDPYAFTQKIADAIHAQGKHVLWRGTWSGIEGIYGFPKMVGSNRFPAGTATSAATDGNTTWLGKTYQYIVSHPNFFQDGDMWAPLPERTEGIFQDSTSFLPYDGAGIQANYANFFINLKTVSDNAFTRINKNVTTGMSANNYTEILSTWMPKSLIDANGIIAIDYYGNNHTPQEMDADLRKMATQYNHPIFLQEWGDYWNNDTNQTASQRSAYLQDMYSEMQELVNDGVLVGFNYWGGWDNTTEGILTKGTNDFNANYRGNILSHFFAANDDSTIVQTTPVSAPATTLSCPPPATNAFTSCYYGGTDFSRLLSTQTNSSINFDWGQGSPNEDVPADEFSIRWRGNYYFNGGNYTFSMASDDGSRLYIDGQLVLDSWSDHPIQTSTVTKYLTAGNHLITMEYYEHGGGAIAKLSWNKQISTLWKKLRR